jgi:hypothetical protein
VHLLQTGGGSAGRQETVKKLLDFCGASYEGPSARFRYGGKGAASVKLTVPGFLVRRQQEDVLLTGMKLEAPVAELLSEQSVSIIRY